MSKEKIKLQDLCRNHSFWSFMKLTKKYKEFIRTESIYSVAITVTILFYFSSLNSDLKAIDLLEHVLSATIPGLIGLIGFIFSGLALMATIISHKVIKRIDSIGKIISIGGILFSFYFCCGIIVGAISCSVIFLGLVYSDTYSGYLCGRWVMWGTIVGTVYLHAFSLLYTVSLVGACLKFFFLNVYYENQCKDE